LEKVSGKVSPFMSSPEELARQNIDALLEKCGWTLQNHSTINLDAAPGIAIRGGLLKAVTKLIYSQTDALDIM
jgi:hypothetical protein